MHVDMGYPAAIMSMGMDIIVFQLTIRKPLSNDRRLSYSGAEPGFWEPKSSDNYALYASPTIHIVDHIVETPGFEVAVHAGNPDNLEVAVAKNPTG
jgi:hypothetical protein